MLTNFQKNVKWAKESFMVQNVVGGNEHKLGQAICPHFLIANWCRGGICSRPAPEPQYLCYLMRYFHGDPRTRVNRA